jgi:SET domain-containing protein
MNKKIFSWINKKLEVKKTLDREMGVFALKDIKENELLIVMGGYIFDIEDENNLNSFNEDRPIEIAEDFSFSPRNESDMDLMPQHYLNHSCEPNVGFKGQLFMVAMRDIEKGEELVYDYAMIIHSNPKSTGFFTMKCLCNSPSCRGTIREDDWKIPALQKKYNGYFQWYIQEKIDGNMEKPYILPE